MERASHKQNCPAGLHFNDQSKICDWPEAAGCRRGPGGGVGGGNAPAISGSSPSGLVEVKASCYGKPDGLYSDPADCAKMIWCQGGAMTKTACPYGLTFDSRTGSCSLFAYSGYH